MMFPMGREESQAAREALDEWRVAERALSERLEAPETASPDERDEPN